MARSIRRVCFGRVSNLICVMFDGVRRRFVNF